MNRTLKILGTFPRNFQLGQCGSSDNLSAFINIAEQN